MNINDKLQLNPDDEQRYDTSQIFITSALWFNSDLDGPSVPIIWKLCRESVYLFNAQLQNDLLTKIYP